uniref:EF-hand domain-containing protein n=1 Tax=Strombidinopsis acuminata TaxID=141414 RepID=A0A7S3RW70_9SPIT
MSASAAQPADVFDAIDTNHDGVISREEFMRMSQAGVTTVQQPMTMYAQPGTVYGQAPMTTYTAQPTTVFAGGMPSEPVATTVGMAQQYAAPQTVYMQPQMQTQMVGAGAPLVAEPVYMTAPAQEYAAPQMMVSPVVTTAEPVWLTAPAVAEPSQATYMQAAPQYMTAAPQYMTTTAEPQYMVQQGATMVAEPVYMTAPAMTTQQVVQAAPMMMQQQYMTMPQQHMSMPMEPVATTQGQQVQYMQAGGQVMYGGQRVVTQQQVQTGYDLFQQLDANHDGVLSREEFEMGMAQPQ